jgi:RNA-directed DNA polymerase
MMNLSLPYVASTLADALLAGPPDPGSQLQRMSFVLGGPASWMTPLARQIERRFGTHWHLLARPTLSHFIAQAPGFIAAWRSETPPRVLRVLKPPPVQQAAPPWLRGAALPHLRTLKDLADWLELHPDELEWFADRWRVSSSQANGPLHHYAYKVVEKRDGRCRIIEMPKSNLRALQRKVLHGLLDRVPAHDSAHGFRQGRSTLTFAAPHVGREVVIRFDLTDFFASVHAGRVHAMWRALGYPLEVARRLTALCTNRVPAARLLAPDLRERLDWQERRRYRDRHLPQGAPTSPALANLCAYRLDCRLAGLARSVGARYTRYADDLAFSGDAELARMAARLSVRAMAIAIEEGFSVNLRKTRVMRAGARQHLAGVVVNEHLNLARPEFDRLKAVLNNCVRHGAQSQNRDAHDDFRAHLAGRVAHAESVNGKRAVKLRALFERIRWEDACEPAA